MADRECLHPIVQTIDEHIRPLTIKCCGCLTTWSLDTMPDDRLYTLVRNAGGPDAFWEMVNEGTRIVDMG